MQHPKTERTLVVIKPDGVQRSLIGEIIGRFERVGLKMVAAKMCVPLTGKKKEYEENNSTDKDHKRKTI